MFHLDAMGMEVSKRDPVEVLEVVLLAVFF